MRECGLPNVPYILYVTADSQIEAKQFAEETDDEFIATKAWRNPKYPGYKDRWCVQMMSESRIVQSAARN